MKFVFITVAALVLFIPRYLKQLNYEYNITKDISLSNYDKLNIPRSITLQSSNPKYILAFIHPEDSSTQTLKHSGVFDSKTNELLLKKEYVNPIKGTRYDILKNENYFVIINTLSKDPNSVFLSFYYKEKVTYEFKINQFCKKLSSQAFLNNQIGSFIFSSEMKEIFLEGDIVNFTLNCDKKIQINYVTGKVYKEYYLSDHRLQSLSQFAISIIIFIIVLLIYWKSQKISLRWLRITFDITYFFTVAILISTIITNMDVAIDVINQFISQYV